MFVDPRTILDIQKLFDFRHALPFFIVLGLSSFISIYVRRQSERRYVLGASLTTKTSIRLALFLTSLQSCCSSSASLTMAGRFLFRPAIAYAFKAQDF
jgi:hypothetical protein